MITSSEPTILCEEPKLRGMEETRIRAGQPARIGTVQGDLVAENHVLIQASDRSIRVMGRALFEGSAEVDGDFECESLKSRDGLLRVNGGLTVHEDVDVEEALYVRGNVKAKSVDVGGRLSVGISLEAQSVDVGGSVEVQGNLSGDAVDVGGSLFVLGEVMLNELDTGGSVDVGGGEVTDKIDVGGTFRSRKPIKFKEIDTGGTIELSGGKGVAVEVGGNLRSNGDVECESVEAGGTVDIVGSLAGKSVDVGGRVRVSGDLRLSEGLEVGGVAEVGGLLSGVDVEVGGRLRTAKAVLTGRARVGGVLESAQGFKTEHIELGNGSRCMGTLVAKEVNLGDNSHADDIYCLHLRVGDHSKLGRVFAETAELGDLCVVEALVYTQELRQGDMVVFRSAPQKSSGLPPFPL